MKKIKFVGLCLLLGVTSLYAKDIAIVTDRNTIDGNLKVNLITHPKYDYDSIDLYQESATRESELIGSYTKGELDDTTVPFNTEYKQSIIRGIVNNPKVLNEGSEVYIKTNLAYYTIEGSPIEWGCLFTGLGEPTKEIWTITSYDDMDIETGKRIYNHVNLPETLTSGTHIVKLEYYDLHGAKFESKKTIKVAKKKEYQLEIKVPNNIKTTDFIDWDYSFNGIVDNVSWYINGELQTTLPRKLSEGDYTIRVDITDDIGIVYSATKEVSITYVESLDNLVKGSFPVGTKISSNVPTRLGSLEDLLKETMQLIWSTNTYSATLTLEFPYAIDISMFEIGKSANPSCSQSITMTGYASDGTKIEEARKFNFYSYLSYSGGNSTSVSTLLKDPEKIYSCWDDLSLKNCTKLKLDFEANSSWASLRHLGLGYTKTEKVE